MKETLYKNLNWIIGILLIIGLICLYFENNIGLITKDVCTIDGATGENTVSLILDYPLSKKILQIFGSIFITLSFAIFIAKYVSAVIREKMIAAEKDNLRAVQEEINEDVHDALFQKIIARELFETIKDEIISADMIRHDGSIHLDFKEVENEIELRITVIYTVVNNTKQDIDNKKTKAIFTNTPEERVEVLKTECRIDNKVVALYDKHQPNNNINVSFEVTDTEVTVINDFIVKAGQSFTDKIIYKNVYLDKVQDEFFTMLPLINLTITVSFPEDYEFEIINMMSPKKVQEIDEPDKHIYKFNGGILPKQGFVYYLKKKIE